VSIPPRRIVFVCGLKEIPDGRGGIERAAQRLNCQLVRRGYSVTVACRGGRSQRRTHDGIDVVVVGSGGGKYSCYFRQMARTVIHLWRYRRTVAVVHLHSPTVHGYWVPLIRALGLPVLAHSHGLEWRAQKWPWWFKGVLWTGLRVGAAFANSVVCVSEEERKYIGSIRISRPADLRVIRNSRPAQDEAADYRVLERFGLQDQGFHLYAGRFVPQKRVLELVDACLRDDWRRPLVIAGASSMSDEYSSAVARRADSHPRIVLTGWLSMEELAALQQKCISFILPSSHEGCPNVLLEAAHAGCAAVVSDIPAHRDLCGDAALYFDLEDWNSLSGIVRRLEDDPGFAVNQRERMARLGTTLPDWSETSHEFEALYVDLCPDLVPHP
jgi:glycosyltransferase involved in cell wall biosynthesis